MPRNGSGTQTSPASSFPAVSGTTIDSAKFNNVINDINSSLTASIANDGQTPILANIPMNNFKFTGLSAGSSAGHSVEYAQFNTRVSAVESSVTALDTGKADSGANTDITSLNAPALGAATATTQSSTDNTTKVATTAHVKSALAAIYASAAENAAGTVEGKAVDPLGVREALNSTGSAPIYAARAWVNFNGNGVVAIRGSGNVSSITDNGTGDYTVNLTTAMSDTNYCGIATCRKNVAEKIYNNATCMPSTTSSVSVCTGVEDVYSGQTFSDSEFISVVIFR